MASKLLGVMTILVFIFGFLYLGFQFGRMVGKDEGARIDCAIKPSCFVMKDCDGDLPKMQGTENGVPGAQF